MDDYDALKIPQGTVDHIQDPITRQRLWERSEPATASGAGAVTFMGNRNRALRSAMFKGKCMQRSYTGKNLLDAALFPAGVVSNGVTFTRINNGVRAVGTATGGSAYYNFDFSGDFLEIGKTYTRTYFSAQELPKLSDGVSYFRADGTNRSHEISKRQSGRIGTMYYSSITFTVPADYVKNRFFIGIGSGNSVNDDIYIQIEESDECTAYEPYVGGIPSPSPQYPQPIVSNDGVWRATGGNLDLGTVSLAANPLRSAIGARAPHGEFADEMDAQTGRVTRRTLCRAFDGTEPWVVYGAGTWEASYQLSGFNLGGNRLDGGLCSHFALFSASAQIGQMDGIYLLWTKDIIITHLASATLADFKAWLAAQAANGTPVEVVAAYPEDTAAESVAAQPLQQVKGNNQLRQISGSLTGEATIVYAKYPGGGNGADDSYYA